MKLINGDCIEEMKKLESNSVDTVLTDPPYGLNFMGKDWDKFGKDKNPAGGDTGKDTPYARNRVAPAFYHYGLEEKNTLQQFTFDWATEALRVAKPGAVMFCFGGTRTVHRVACGIEDAGWEIRDTMMWIYGSGFPKSHNISKAIDKRAGAERERIPNPLAGKQTGQEAGKGLEGERNQNLFITTPATDSAQLWDGWGTALKPAFEPIIVAMKPRDGTFVENALKWGVAGLNIDGGRAGHQGGTKKGSNPQGKSKGIYGEGLHGACEIDNINKGRWPANILHDGSKEVIDGFPIVSSGKPGIKRSQNSGFSMGEESRLPGTQMGGFGDSGSAARFFYCAKASKEERNAGLEGMPLVQKYKKDGSGNSHEVFTSESATDEVWAKKNPNLPVANNHPTVKPLSLMVYLSRLSATPTGGVVLDPFMGSGTTGMACKQTGREFIGIELDPHYFEIAEKRIDGLLQVELF